MMNAKPLTVVLALAGLAALSGCATPQTAAEPLPAEVERRLETIRAERTDYPRFQDIPSAPQNLRTPGQWSQAVGAVETRGGVVGTWAARNPAWITDPEGDGARLQARTVVAPQDMPRPDQQALTEAFAASLRAQAIPPEPIK